jgi:hypothetical protein
MLFNAPMRCSQLFIFLMCELRAGARLLAEPSCCSPGLLGDKLLQFSMPGIKGSEILIGRCTNAQHVFHGARVAPVTKQMLNV